jgi:Spy/CpxP family protein refolding chaperone
MSSSITTTIAIACLFSGFGLAPVAMADEEHHGCIDWARLNLTPSQNTQIQQLNTEWTGQYSQIKPVIDEDKVKLTRLLADHESDPVEVMSLQQSIARKKEQLNGYATANYLKKRQILTSDQQYNLEQMIKDAVRRRQQQMYPGAHGDQSTDHIQSLMNRVRNSWHVQPEK